MQRLDCIARRAYQPLNTPVKAKHIAGIDAVRLIAAVLVMLFHYGFWVGVHNGTSAKASQGLIAFPEFYPYTQYGWIGVQVFFVISGFVIAFSGEKATAFSFLLARLVRLLPAALICASVTLAAAFIVHYASYRELTMAYLRSILFLPFGPYIDDSYWTLAIEVAFYSMVFLMISMGRFQWIKRLAIVLGLISTMFLLTYLAASTHPDGAFFNKVRYILESRVSDLLLVNHGCFFALGIFLWLQLVKQSSWSNVVWCVLFTMVGCLQIYTVNLIFLYRFNIAQSAIVPCLIWLGSLTTIILAVKFNERVHQGPAWLIASFRRMGLMTYPLYLIHQIVGLIMMAALVKEGAHPYAALTASMGLAFVASWGICTYLEPPVGAAVKKLLLKFRDGFTAFRLKNPVSLS